LFATNYAGVAGWQLYESAANPAVAAIQDHAVSATATLIQAEIDGPGGDPAVSYRYTVGGRSFTGYDLASKATGDALDKRAGDPIPIQYAATMPDVSCVAESTDCPNSVYDPFLFVVVFWALAVITAGVAFTRTALRKRRRRRSLGTPMVG
jgi:hypothetical protein